MLKLCKHVTGLTEIQGNRNNGSNYEF